MVVCSEVDVEVGLRWNCEWQLRCQVDNCTKRFVIAKHQEMHEHIPCNGAKPEIKKRWEFMVVGTQLKYSVVTQYTRRVKIKEDGD